MKPTEYRQPRVPIAYVIITFEQAAARGISQAQLVADLDFDPAILHKPDARIPLLTYGHMVARLLRISDDPGLGYDFGLRTTLTSHGLLGFGLMSQPSLRHALELGEKFVPHLRSPGFTLRFFTEGEDTVLEAREAVPYGPLRQYAYDMLLVSFSVIIRSIAPGIRQQLWFDCPEPEHYAQYRNRLPEIRFNMGTNQLRVRTADLDIPLSHANITTAELVARQCEEELSRIGATDDLMARVRAMMINANNGYLTLEELAGNMNTSTRTLKRKLKEHETSYQQLLDEARCRDSIRLLEETTLPLDEIAYRVGYSESSNFCRAFQRWTGKAPGSYRR